MEARLSPLQRKMGIMGFTTLTLSFIASVVTCSTSTEALVAPAVDFAYISQLSSDEAGQTWNPVTYPTELYAEIHPL